MLPAIATRAFASLTVRSYAAPFSFTYPSLVSFGSNNNMIQYRGFAKSCIKTNKSVAKRIRVGGSGRVKRNKSGKSHNTGYKTRGRVNRLAASCGINGKSIEKRMRRLIGA